MKEWNVSYSMHDGCGERRDFFVVLSSWWGFVWWFLRHARFCCEIYVWITWNGIED